MHENIGIMKCPIIYIARLNGRAKSGFDLMYANASNLWYMKEYQEKTWETTQLMSMTYISLKQELKERL